MSNASSANLRSAGKKPSSASVFSRRVAPYAPLALSLLTQTMSLTPAPKTTAMHNTTTQSHSACQTDLESCPDNGCAAANSPHALANALKRRQLVEEGMSPTVLSFADLHQLQDEAIQLVGDTARDLKADQREKLHGLPLAGGGQASEGDLVSLMGFVVGTPHANTGESVNCYLHGEDNNDFHIPVSDRPQSSFRSPSEAEFSAVVVEMIPQDRSPDWTLPRLGAQRDGDHAILVTGQLFYDNLHHPNGDPSHPLAGQPRRFALWEIHPISSFKVCMLADNACTPDKPDGWVPIEQIKSGEESDAD